MRPPSVSRLLTRHFLRRFFENDLISPHVDLHENAVALGAGLVSLSLFASVFVGSSYLIGLPPPGVIAVTSLAQNFTFLNIAMFAMALIAALQWDALSLDLQDVANLGPLPIRRRVLVAAKLKALAIFSLGFSAALTVFPSFIFNSAVVVKLPVGVKDMLRLDLAHLLASVLACACGFLSVVAIRETLRAFLGAGLFTRLSALVQGGLVLTFTSGLLLTPAFTVRMNSTWLPQGLPMPWLLPSLAFAGFEQVLGGSLIANIALVPVSSRMQAANNRALAMYHAQEGYFQQCEAIALLLAGGALTMAALAYAWNLRQMPQPVSSSTRRRSTVSVVTMLAGQDDVRRAGLSFALRAIVRSAPHRLAMAGAAALATALTFMFLSGAGFRSAANPWHPPVLILAVQTMVISILLAGFRRAISVPAELRANWIMQLTWQQSERRFLMGVKLAAIIGVALPTVLLLAPLHVWLLSPRAAAIHLLIGLAYGVAVNELFFASCRRVPLASTYEPLTNVKAVGPIVFLLFLLFVNTFARIERVALESNQGIVNFLMALIATTVIIRVIDDMSRRGRSPMKFDEPPEPATQWLGLSG